MATVLIVDDEESIQKLVVFHFQRSGYEIETCGNGRDAYERIRKSPGAFDLIVLDLMLPGMDGMEVCKRLRAEQIRTPIILLTARDDEVDLILGLELGADDYVTKPFSPRELIARARAVLRRSETAEEGAATDAPVDEKRLANQQIVLDVGRHEVTVRGEQIDLTPKEFDLLEYFMKNKAQVLTRDQLLDRVWGYSSSTDTRIVDVHVSHLREKIEEDAKNPVFIRTVRGVGYKFNEGAGPAL
ncbi:response regulator transcription factor [Alicyclobacillus sp. ALC3]|uniref:response regulator transcription factor n=1 Tax=Alicyclobacillus sp. ALC3 TaxID=2796143 RepID=UPI002379303E|nr:response regulator transcription factor [Alicyclobacillus sp. ALC3]WDL98708.1 response regulator transcription factor [Alicyclobacillus sp. ALC3]